MSNPDFVYTTYIKTTQAKVWAAITNPEFTRQYWANGITSDANWKKGSKWHQSAEGQCGVGGEVLESEPPRRLVLSWADPANPSDDSKVTFEIEQVEDMVRLNIVHGGFKPGSIIAGKISQGWPRVLSSLKTLLETGAALNTWAGLEMPTHVKTAAA